MNQQAKSKNNSNHHYIFIGAAVGSVIGLALGSGLACMIGITTLSPIATVSIFIGAAVAGALLGAGVGCCVSRCFDKPNVENIEAVREEACATVL
ncbi:hypothetical protein [Wolbachia endosymbiont of Folsomia candida]|uniref:hypothetical protein n=1 Tax=Wolbachia endosymbiont of Folsomia candida TaxID=169402 RepID=UPI000B62253F|nr:hypothetical protein [Wolbachia endosymbiont of Folsomia candida]APR98258.1 hypothetical protein ASM33_03055 [Wolbachia endosymbiont of Folsomia candida]